MSFGLDLLGHVHLVKADDSLLELLVVSDVVQCIVYLIFELLLLLFLSLQDLAQVTVLTNQPTHPHSQILNNQTQVHKDSLEMSLLLLHLICLLLELVDSVASWPNITLQLLDLVIKHKLELLQFLSLLL